MPVAFLQVAQGGLRLSPGERTPDSVIRSDLRAIARQGQLGIWAKIRRDLLRFRFVDANLPGAQGRIIGFEALPHLIPR
jgi:hypothetical protein